MKYYARLFIIHSYVIRDQLQCISDRKMHQSTVDASEPESLTSLSKSEGDLKRLAGFRFNLPNGESRMLPLETDMANRLLVHFTLAEIQALFDNVARCTLEPNDEHLCHILAAREKAD